MKNYETVFILNPALSEEQVEKAVDKYEKFLKSNGAKIVSKEIWGLKKLAYSIQNKNSGFYNLIEYTAIADVVSSLELEFSRDETVMRYLTDTLEKDAIEWAEKNKINWLGQFSVILESVSAMTTLLVKMLLDRASFGMILLNSSDWYGGSKKIIIFDGSNEVSSHCKALIR